MKVALVFLLAVAFVNAAVPARRSQINTNVRSSAARDLSLTGINDFLANFEAQLPEILAQVQANLQQAIQNAKPIIQQAIEDARPVVQQIIAMINQMQQNFQENGVQGLINQILSLLNNRSAAQRNFLVDMLINAVLGSSSFQNLIKEDSTFQCLKNEQNIHIDNNFIMNTIANGAYEFVTVTAKNCIDKTGGLQEVVQKSPVIQFAYKTAKSFGMKNTVHKAIREKLGNQLGNEIIGYLENNPHARLDILALISQINSVFPLEELISYVVTNFSAIVAYVQANLDQIIATVVGLVQEHQEIIMEYVHAYGPMVVAFIQEHLPSVLPFIPQQYQQLVLQVVAHLQQLVENRNPLLRAY